MWRGPEMAAAAEEVPRALQPPWRRRASRAEQRSYPLHFYSDVTESYTVLPRGRTVLRRSNSSRSHGFNHPSHAWHLGFKLNC
jgi:hypothetical protein